MKLNEYQKERLFNKLKRIFIELNTTELGKNATAKAVESTIDDYDKRRLKEEGYFPLKWWKSFGGEAYHASHYLLEIINMAKAAFEKCGLPANVWKNNSDAKIALQHIDNVEAEFREEEKDINDSEVIKALKLLQENQEKMLKSLMQLSSTQEKMKATLDDIDIPVPHNYHSELLNLEIRLNGLKTSIESVNTTVNELNDSRKEKERSHTGFFGRKAAAN
jgi:hypothetical protein